MDRRRQAVRLFRPLRRIGVELGCLIGISFAFFSPSAILAQQSEQAPEWKASSAASRPIVPVQATAAAASETLSLEDAVRYALANNPQLAAVRQQYGIASAAVVIAKTYPYNPIWQGAAAGDFGPPSAGVTNPVFIVAKIAMDVEVRGQRQFRQQAAFAALTRTQWEIASQEVTFAINTVRAFDGLVYRQSKLALTEEFAKLNQKAAEQVKELVDRGTLRPADLMLARGDVNDVQSQIGLHRTSLVTARRDFARALGKPDLTAIPSGALDRPAPTVDANQLLDSALEHRPDLFARQTAITEADARLRLQIADRFGNLNIGPMYEYNETSVNIIGLQIGSPIPVFNNKRGEIKQREAERMLAILTLRQSETEIRQDVAAAAARVVEARSWMNKYQQDILPDLRKNLEEMDKLFQQGQAGVDVLRVLDTRRKLLRAQDGYLDALLAYSQALADLGLAVGDPAAAMGLYQKTEAPAK
jgi:outer membrane protein TolC